MATFPVKMFASTDAGAPALSGTQGSLIGVLKAVLLNGYNSQAPSSITVTGGVATATFPTPHNFEEGRIIRLSGANEAPFNSDWKVKEPTPLTLKFDVGGTFPAAATGSLSFKYSPLDWENTYDDVSAYKSVFRSADPSSTKYSLIVEDATNSYSASYPNRTSQLRMAANAYSTTAWDRSTTVGFRKAQNASSTARPWYIFGDRKRFYIAVNWSESYPGNYDVVFFGDVVSYKPGDAHHCLLQGWKGISTGDTADPVGWYQTSTSAPPYLRDTSATRVWTEFDTYLDVCLSADINATLTQHSLGSFGFKLGRSYHQAGGFTEGMPCAGVSGGLNQLYNGSLEWNSTAALYASMAKPGISNIPYPNPVDNSVMFQFPMYVRESSFGGAVRGHMPGLLIPMHNISPTPAVMRNVRVNGTSFRDVFVIQTPKMNALVTGRAKLAFDITGPWE